MQADQTSANQSQSIANNQQQLRTGNNAVRQFADERPGTITQRKIQEALNNGSGTRQLQSYQGMANSSKQVQQLKAYQAMADNRVVQTAALPKENKTGLPDQLKSGVEQLSGVEISDVKVHYNSPKPAQLQAHAYAQGADIHIGPGQEKHLAHEAWHVVQQKQGRVKPTLQMKSGVPVNDDAGLEQEADAMGAKALQIQMHSANKSLAVGNSSNYTVAQFVVDWAAVEKTAADNYAVSADHSTLYSKGDAAAPEPASLYAQGTETTNDEVPAALKTWKPNVKFLTGSAIDHGHVPTQEERAGWEDGSIDQPDNDTILGELRPEYERIKAEVTEAMEAEPAEGGASPTTGIVGRNDCAQWANALQGLIYRSREAVEAAVKRDFDLGAEADPDMEGAPAVGVGDKMEQQLGEGAGSGHHGATVVVTDGASLVTLEAHVEKELTAPEFHIHEGLSGFVDSNNAGPEGPNQFLEANGRNGSVTPLGASRETMENRITMLDHYAGELNADDNDQKLSGIQGLLRYYEAVVPEVEAEVEAEAEAPPQRRWRCCFLTTACVSYRGLPDDCEELTVLRKFRDNYMRNLPEGESLIQKYYEVAPGIVAAINRSPKRRDIYEELYLILRACVEAIKAGNHSLALRTYKEMVIELHQKYQ